MPEPITIVTGLGRCGTSLVMQMLHAGGMACAGEYPAFEPEETNPASFDAAYVAAQPGKEVKLLNLHWQEVQLAPAEYRFIVLRRDPREQARSHAKFLRYTAGIEVDRPARRRLGRAGPPQRGASMTAHEQMNGWQRSQVPKLDRNNKLQFFPTPPGATVALMEVEFFPGKIWEPASGEGHMAEVLRRYSHDVLATDVADYGYSFAITPIDFLMERGFRSDHVITNPPYRLAQEFAAHALERVRGKVALFLPIRFLTSEGRSLWLETTPLARVHYFRNRVPMQRGRLQDPGDNSGKTTDYAWFVWDHSHRGPSTNHWITYREEAADDR